MIRIPPGPHVVFNDMVRRAMEFIGSDDDLNRLPVGWNVPLANMADPRTQDLFSARFESSPQDAIVSAGYAGTPHWQLTDEELTEETTPDRSSGLPTDAKNPLPAASVPFYPVPDPFGTNALSRYRASSPLLLSWQEGETAGVLFMDSGTARLIPTIPFRRGNSGAIGGRSGGDSGRSGGTDGPADEMLLFDCSLAADPFARLTGREKNLIFRSARHTVSYTSFPEWISAAGNETAGRFPVPEDPATLQRLVGGRRHTADSTAAGTGGGNGEKATGAAFLGSERKKRSGRKPAAAPAAMPWYGRRPQFPPGKGPSVHERLAFIAGIEPFPEEPRNRDAEDEMAKRILASDMPGEVEMEGEGFTVRFIQGRMAGMTAGERKITPAIPVKSALKAGGKVCSFERTASYSIEEEGLRGLREIRRCKPPFCAEQGILRIDYLFRDNDPLLYISVETVYPVFQQDTTIERADLLAIPVRIRQPGTPFIVSGLRHAGSPLLASIPSDMTAGGYETELAGTELSFPETTDTVTLRMEDRDGTAPHPFALRTELTENGTILWVSMHGWQSSRRFGKEPAHAERFSFTMDIRQTGR